jgi:hypothetical protein
MGVHPPPLRSSSWGVSGVYLSAPVVEVIGAYVLCMVGFSLNLLGHHLTEIRQKLKHDWIIIISWQYMRQACLLKCFTIFIITISPSKWEHESCLLYAFFYSYFWISSWVNISHTIIQMKNDSLCLFSLITSAIDNLIFFSKFV